MTSDDEEALRLAAINSARGRIVKMHRRTEIEDGEIDANDGCPVEQCKFLYIDLFFNCAYPWYQVHDGL